MLQLTADAGALLAHYLEESDATRDAAVRFIFEGGEFALELDRPHPGDAQFKHRGRVVLLLDRATSDSLTNNTLDVKASPQGPTLQFM